MVAMIGFALLSVLILAITIFFVLVFRQAVLVVLVIAAPIVFALKLLPNTKSVFDKWFSMFKAMLLLYPIVGVILGASSLVAKILANTGGFYGGLSALVVSFVPFLALPNILKGSLSAIDKATGAAIGSKITGVGDKYRKKAGERSKAGFDRSQMGQNIAAMKRVHQARLTKKANTNAAKAGGGGIGAAIKRGFVPRGKATINDLQGHGRAEQNKQDQEALGEATGWMQQNNLDSALLGRTKLADGITESPAYNKLMSDDNLTGAQFAAIYKRHAGAMNKKERDEILEKASADKKRFGGTDNLYLRESLSSSTKDAGGSYAGGGDMDNFVGGGAHDAAKIREKAASQLYNGNTAAFASEDPDDLKALEGTKFEAKDSKGNAIKDASGNPVMETFSAQGAANNIVNRMGGETVRQTLDTIKVKPGTSTLLINAINTSGSYQSSHESGVGEGEVAVHGGQQAQSQAAASSPIETNTQSWRQEASSAKSQAEEDSQRRDPWHGGNSRP